MWELEYFVIQNWIEHNVVKYVNALHKKEKNSGLVRK